VLKTAVRQAKLGHFEELAAIRRLDEQSRRLERHASGASIEALFADERTRSHQYVRIERNRSAVGFRL
jgi:lipase chaperone LimK